MPLLRINESNRCHRMQNNSIPTEKGAGPLRNSVELRRPAEHLPGVGYERGQLLRRLGIHTAADLIFNFPRGYEEVAELKTPIEFEPNQRVSFLGSVASLEERYTQSGKHMLGVLVDSDSPRAERVEDQSSTERNPSAGSVRLLWFNQPFRKRELVPGTRVMVTGVPKSTVLNWEMVQPQVVVLSGGEAPSNDAPLPVYGLTEGLKQPHMRRLMRQALPPVIELVPEVLPDSVRERLSVLGIRDALQQIHFPTDLDSAELARRRFKLQELLVLQLAITLQRTQRESSATAPVCEPSGKVHSRILNRLGLTLTGDQERAILDIGRDMARSVPMNRLLQGDVGSGKTVVAQYAMLLCVAHNMQAALMAPTEVLAQQHAETLQKSLSSSRVRVGLLTGSLTKAQRRDQLQRIADGEIDLVVGTQALLSEDLVFKDLGLVIVDEQHKFGVLQRAKLRTDGQQPHYLVLSATPIPRTISMTDFGDLDVSTIREKPPGRAELHTYTALRHELDSWWKFVDSKIDEGRQAFVIAPRVSNGDESDGASDSETPLFDQNASRASAEAVFQFLVSTKFSHRRIGLVHGRMSGEEKHVVLQAFAAGDVDLLVATTVVEVGINIPNATVMTILDADRLGLSQLHQLRGRVARGSHPGYVCAVASPDNEQNDEKQPPEHERLKAFEQCDDGFELAELDLQMRGPGDLLGTSQSGLPRLRIADLVQDEELLLLARQVARDVLEESPMLEGEQFTLLKKQTLNRYGEGMQLSDIG